MRTTTAAVALVMALTACGGGSDTEEPTSTVPETPLTPFGNVVNQADDIASAVNQRTADLESQLTP